MLGAQAVAANTLAKRGIEPALPLAYALIFLETVGAVCITLGFLTRPIAVALVIEFVVIIYQHIPNGYAWMKGADADRCSAHSFFLPSQSRGGGQFD